ncbi:hypothetical protein GUF51_16165, partial [Xanthomonas citri pv. citri]|nr:hypothetical protein [Xanthomonas citri pv. citri]
TKGSSGSTSNTSTTSKTKRHKNNSDGGASNATRTFKLKPTMKQLSALNVWRESTRAVSSEVKRRVLELLKVEDDELRFSQADVFRAMFDDGPMSGL